eukprot:TRINITY_DN4949_c0_g1_i3.p1 TRINITY_DN4949_c0_g1~~TRINITY_DN4949_c0_g1_i3.p1  ORF type:complete len:569 (+),score=179.85 TRINITY_DN4949_c0_g1_i3:63-1709(+)
MAGKAPALTSVRDIVQALQGLQQRDGPLHRALAALRRSNPASYAAGHRSLEQQLQQKGEQFIIPAPRGAPEASAVKKADAGGAPPSDASDKRVRLRLPTDAPPESPEVSAWRSSHDSRPHEVPKETHVVTVPGQPPADAQRSPQPEPTAQKKSAVRKDKGASSPQLADKQGGAKKEPPKGALLNAAGDGVVIAVREMLCVQRVLVSATAVLRNLTSTSPGGLSSTMAQRETAALRKELEGEREKVEQLRQKLHRADLRWRKVGRVPVWQTAAKASASTEERPQRQPLRWQPQRPVSPTVRATAAVSVIGPPPSPGANGRWQQPLRSPSSETLPPLLPHCPPSRRRRNPRPRPKPLEQPPPPNTSPAYLSPRTPASASDARASPAYASPTHQQIDAAAFDAAVADGGYDNGSAAQGFRLFVSAFCADVSKLLSVYIKALTDHRQPPQLQLPPQLQQQLQLPPQAQQQLQLPPQAQQPPQRSHAAPPGPDPTAKLVERTQPFFVADPVSHRLLTRQDKAGRQWLDEVGMLTELYTAIKAALIQQLQLKHG